MQRGMSCHARSSVKELHWQLSTEDNIQFSCHWCQLVLSHIYNTEVPDGFGVHAVCDERIEEEFQIIHAVVHNRFTALWILFGTTRVSQYQKKHSPTHTHRGHQISLTRSQIIHAAVSDLNQPLSDSRTKGCHFYVHYRLLVYRWTQTNQFSIASPAPHIPGICLMLIKWVGCPLYHLTKISKCRKWHVTMYLYRNKFMYNL